MSDSRPRPRGVGSESPEPRGAALERRAQADIRLLKLLVAIEREARAQGVLLVPHKHGRASAAVGRALWLMARRSGLTVGVERRPLHEELLAARGGAAETRDRLAVFADELQAGGDPLGGLISLRLAGRLEARHVLGVEVHRGHSGGTDRLTAEYAARRWLGQGALEANIQQLPSLLWEAECYKNRPALEARPT